MESVCSWKKLDEQWSGKRWFDGVEEDQIKIPLCNGQKAYSKSKIEFVRDDFSVEVRTPL